MIRKINICADGVFIPRVGRSFPLSLSSPFMCRMGATMERTMSVSFAFQTEMMSFYYLADTS